MYLSMYLAKTRRFWRSRLPHWEIEAGTYFITIRADLSLPSEVSDRICEIRDSMSEIEPRSEAFARLQRRYFLTMEKYLDCGEGFCPFQNPECCRIVTEAMKGLRDYGWRLRHYVIMPNHVHAVLDTTADARGLKEVWRQWKGRTARKCNEVLERRGSFWQKEWFDRWVRDEAEMRKTVEVYSKQSSEGGSG